MAMKYVSRDHSEFIEMLSWARRKCVQGENCTIAINALDEHPTTKLHSHPQEQITYILDGESDFCVGERKLYVKAGDVLVIPPNVPHGGGSGKVTMIDFFASKREDFVECPYEDKGEEA